VACWINRTRALPSRSVLQGLLEDKHPAVRLTLLAAAQDLAPQTRTELIQLLTRDVDAYVRARARQALEDGDS
jgi:HEAT repeat protein